MSRYCTSHKNQHGFTLVELLVTVTVLSIVVAGLCDVYLANQRAWDRQSGSSTALFTTSSALSAVAPYVENAVDIYTADKVGSNDALMVCLPADSAYGIYVPSDGEYQRGNIVVFYLSDSTGSYSHTGNILWAGTMPYWSYPTSWNVTPDTNWSRYPGGTNGRITPVTSLHFSEVGGWYSNVVQITVTATYKSGKGTATLTRTRTICSRTQSY